MKQYTRAVLTCVSVLALLSCSSGGSSGPDEQCGPEITDGARLLATPSLGGSNSAVALASSTNFANEPGSQASISWKIELKNICTKQHSKVWVETRVSKEKSNEVGFNALIWYDIFKERPLTLEKLPQADVYEWYGHDEFGIRDAYGDGPGEFFVFVDMTFPSTGYWDTDSAYVDTYLQHLNILAKAWEFK